MPKNAKNNSRGPLILMIAGFLLILGAVGMAAFILKPSKPPVSQITPTFPGTFPDVVRISPEDAKAAYDQGSASFIDVRSLQEYEQRHVSGALSVPLLDLGSRIGELNPSTWYITY